MDGSTHDHRFPCRTCGSDLRFDPSQNALRCDHCGAVEQIEDAGPWRGTAVAELDLRRALAHQLPEVEVSETRMSRCPNCGAQVEFDPTVHAKECPFCATPVVTDTGIERQIKPKGVLPFSVDEPGARLAMNDWLGSLWFAPGGLRDYARKGRKMDGLYVPYWTFDAQTRSSYTGKRGDDYYETRTVMRDGKREQVQVRKTDWTSVRGRVSRFFDDVLVLASQSLPRKFTDALQPWDLAALEPYRPEYLAGFRAEAYQVELDEAYGDARNQMDRIIQRDVRFDIGGDRQRIDSIDTEVGDATFKHILLPIWVAAYKYRGKTYRFVVNGRTGRVQGERPWSIWKIGFAVLAGLLVAGAIGYAMAMQQNGGDLQIYLPQRY